MMHSSLRGFFPNSRVKLLLALHVLTANVKSGVPCACKTLAALVLL